MTTYFHNIIYNIKKFFFLCVWLYFYSRDILVKSNQLTFLFLVFFFSLTPKEKRSGVSIIRGPFFPFGYLTSIGMRLYLILLSFTLYSYLHLHLHLIFISTNIAPIFHFDIWIDYFVGKPPNYSFLRISSKNTKYPHWDCVLPEAF